MTHDDMIAVIQAHKEGKAIELRQMGRSNWEFRISGNPDFNFLEYEYRVKKVAREFDFYEYKSNVSALQGVVVLKGEIPFNRHLFLPGTTRLVEVL